MDAAATLVLTHLQNMGTEVLAKTQAAYAMGGADALSRLARKRVFAYALVVQQGEALHSATALEHQYETIRVLQDKIQRLVTELNASETTVAALMPVGGGYSLLRCSRNGIDSDICVAVDVADVTLALHSALGLVTRTTGLTRVGLVGPNGASIAFEEGGVVSTASHPFDGLLNGWQLRGEDQPSDDSNLQSTLFLYVVAGALIVGWLGLMWMLHRSALLKEEAAAARANVIAQLAHELRTPLANLKLHTDLLRRKASDAASVKRYGSVLDGEIDRLSQIAENAIAVARGAMARPRLETAVPDECLRAILERFEPTLTDAHCSVRFAPGASKASRFDRTSWERCIINLIDNARKYAPGSDIEISTTQSLEMLRLDVIDRGPGIPADQRERIFEPLERGAMARASGFGLGLAAVRTLARQNGGSCWIEAMNPGSHFILTMQALPAKPTLQESASPC